MITVLWWWRVVGKYCYAWLFDRRCRADGFNGLKLFAYWNLSARDEMSRLVCGNAVSLFHGIPILFSSSPRLCRNASYCSQAHTSATGP
jgi:hypothetical protein